MSDDEDYLSEEDEDYVPSEGEAVSEEENSGDEEDFVCLKEDVDTGFKGKQKKGKTKKAEVPSRERKGGIKLDGEDEEDKEGSKEDEEAKMALQQKIAQEQLGKKEEAEKKRANDLWSSFLSDVGDKPKTKPSTGMTGGLGSLASLTKPSLTDASCVSVVSKCLQSKDKVTVTKVYDFAGEAVKVTKEVDANSKEAKEMQEEKTEEKMDDEVKPTNTASQSVSGLGKRLSTGLGSVLDRMNKKPKISTLEKSKLDWDSFKQKEGITEELQIHNRGKSGYLERVAFLERTDYREFEKERDIRLSSSSKR